MTTFSATGHSARVFGTATGGSNRRSSLSPSNGSNDSGGGGGKSTDVGSGGKAGGKNGPAERFLGGNKFQVGLSLIQNLFATFFSLFLLHAPF